MIAHHARWALLAGSAALAAAAAPAGAVFSANDVACKAVVNIHHDDRVFTVDARDGEARVPRDGTFNWRGETAEPAHDLSGEVGLRVAFWTIPIASWGPSANAGNDLVATGNRAVPGLLQALPRGKYRITGAMRGAEGRCAGTVVVDVGAGAFDSAAGIAAVAGTPLYAAAVVLVTRRRRVPGQRVLAAFVGLLFGIMVAVDLVVANLVVSDSPLLVALPMVVPLVTVVVVGRRR